MKTKYVSIIAMIGFALILSSCSDSSTNPTPSNDYFPVTAGSYFVYNNIRLDSTTGNRDMNALQVDSLIVLAATNKENNRSQNKVNKTRILRRIQFKKTQFLPRIKSTNKEQN